MNKESFNRMEYESYLADVEKIGDTPIVLSPYGLTKKTIEGKQYLVAMTKEEGVAALAQLTGLSIHDATERLSTAFKCYTGYNTCASTGCDGPHEHCQYLPVQGYGYICTCVYSGR